MNTLVDALKEAQRQDATRRKPVQREHKFQASAVEYARLALPAAAVITSIDHANASAGARAAKAAQGVLPGIPDILITWTPDPSTGLHLIGWMETKARKGVLSTAQKVWRELLLASGAYWCAPRTLDDVAAFLASMPIPLRPVHLL